MAAPRDTVPTATITLTHRSTTHIFTLPLTSPLSRLSSLIESELSIPPQFQKFLVPKRGLIKASEKAGVGLEELGFIHSPGIKITLLGSSTDEVVSVQKGVEAAPRVSSGGGGGGGGGLLGPGRVYTGPLKPARPVSTSSSRNNIDTNTSPYRFLAITPLYLSHLPSPSTSLSYLNRLASDPGISHIMRKHHFAVSLLTELDPTSPQYTSLSGSKILGLNRNKGEVIELRLRTDDLSGWRDYRTVRRTVVHELVHNVYSEHDGKFWGLYRELEKEVLAKAAEARMKVLAGGGKQKSAEEGRGGGSADGGSGKSSSSRS